MIYWLMTMSSFLIAPLIYRYIHRLEHSYVIVETFLFFAIAGLVVVHILPESIALAGWGAVGAFLISWLLPTLGERLMHRHAESVHMIPIVVSVIGLISHGLIDGLSLAYAGDFNGPMADAAGLHYHPLPLAVVIHSFPASLFVWWVLRPRYGLRTASVVMAVMALSTSLGFFSGADIIQKIHGTASMGVFEAIAAGSLMHLASHRIGHDH